MDLYDKTALRTATLFTRAYSTSFSAASRLFASDVQPHIYAIYGLVRIADEIVDTYQGKDAENLLDSLEADTHQALKSGFSANPLVHAFAQTARQYGIGKDLITPFFASMRMDLTPQQFNQRMYRRYIVGSAEVVGLMCLKVFFGGDGIRYRELEPGARRLGAAYQKVNFLRDLAADHTQLGRFYFPGTTFDAFDDTAKQAVIDDIAADFEAAAPYVRKLPKSAQAAVATSYEYYRTLLQKLERTSADTLKEQRLRLPAHAKIRLLMLNYFRSKTS